jgi:hypothetical protein
MERRTVKWFSDAKGYGFIRLPTFGSLDQVVRIGRSDAGALWGACRSSNISRHGMRSARS